eukprot:gene10382-10540_t
MGNSNSRIDKFYGNYEKSFERIQLDEERINSRTALRARRKANLSMWCWALVVLAMGVAAAIIWKVLSGAQFWPWVQQQPQGTFTYQEHFNRVSGAMLLPAVAYSLYWVMLFILKAGDKRDAKKLRALHAAKRSMIKELKEMSRYDRIKALIDKFDPDAAAAPPAPPSMLAPPGRGGLGPAVPALLVRGSGHVAGAAAMAMAEAGKAIMPLVDKLANSIMSDDPLLLADLRNTEVRVAGTEYNSCLVRCDNLNLKQRILELELKLELPPSYDPDMLQQEMRQLQVQHQAVQQQLQHVIQQCNKVAASSDGALVVGPGGMLTSPAPAGSLARHDGAAQQAGQISNDSHAQQLEHQQEAVPGAQAGLDKVDPSSQAANAMAVVSEEALIGGDGTGEGLQGVEQVKQAVAAVEAAWKDGVKQQRLELLLPLIGATDLDDWPGGIRQQFKAAAPLVEAILRQLKTRQGLQGPLNVDIWDQGDAVGAWFGDNLAAVLFPTADTLKQLKQLAERQPQLLLIVNPQWELEGNLVSDFGFGQRKADALQLVSSFQPTYWLKQIRVDGDELRVLRGHPGKWQVHVVKRDGSDMLLAAFDDKPSYNQLQEALKTWDGAAANKSLIDRIRDEMQFIQDTAQQQPPKE